MSHLRLKVQELEARLAEEGRRHAEAEAMWKEERTILIKAAARLNTECSDQVQHGWGLETFHKGVSLRADHFAKNKYFYQRIFSKNWVFFAEAGNPNSEVFLNIYFQGIPLIKSLLNRVVTFF